MKNDIVDMQLELDVSYISATEVICFHLSLLKNPHKGANAHKICVQCTDLFHLSFCKQCAVLLGKKE